MAVAIARYYFYSVTGVVAPVLNLTNSRSYSDAIDKVAVAHLCCYVTINVKAFAPFQPRITQPKHQTTFRPFHKLS